MLDHSCIVVLSENFLKEENSERETRFFRQTARLKRQKKIENQRHKVSLEIKLIEKEKH